MPPYYCLTSYQFAHNNESPAFPPLRQFPLRRPSERPPFIVFIFKRTSAHHLAASRCSNVMATHDEYSMISPPSSFSNCPEQPSKLPPYPPPLRSGQVLQTLSEFPGGRAKWTKAHKRKNESFVRARWSLWAYCWSWFSGVKLFALGSRLLQFVHFTFGESLSAYQLSVLKCVFKCAVVRKLSDLCACVCFLSDCVYRSEFGHYVRTFVGRNWFWSMRPLIAVTTISSEGSYDYVFGGPSDKPTISHQPAAVNAVKLTSAAPPPVRPPTDGKCSCSDCVYCDWFPCPPVADSWFVILWPAAMCSAEVFHRSSIDNGRHHYVRRSLGHGPSRCQRPLADTQRSIASSRGDRGDYDEDSLRQLLLE